jgi:hypothetical protein
MAKITKHGGASVRVFQSPAQVLRQRGKLGPYGGEAAVAKVETFGEHTAQGVAAVERLIREAATEDQLDIVWRGPAEQRDRYAAAVEARRAELAAGQPAGEPEVDLAAVRAWAADNGIVVSPRGRVAKAVVDQYLAAQHPHTSAAAGPAEGAGGVP